MAARAGWVRAELQPNSLHFGVICGKLLVEQEQAPVMGQTAASEIFQGTLCLGSGR